MVKFIQEQHPPGTRIRLNSMSDPYSPVPTGMEGIVDWVDDEGQIQMTWNNGRTLPLVPGEDSFTVLPPKLETLKLYAPLTADLCEYDRYGDLDDESVVLDGRSLLTYQDKIAAAIVKSRMPEEAERGVIKSALLFSQWKNGMTSSGVWQNAALLANWMQKNWKR